MENRLLHVAMTQAIQAADFKARLPHLKLLDIRTPDEIADFNLGGLFITMDVLLEKLDLLSAWQNEEFVVLCYTGLQSKVATTILHKKGFTQARNLEGGLEAYLSL